MTNYRRWRVSGGTYFFTVVTLGRRPFLTDDLAFAPRGLPHHAYTPAVSGRRHRALARSPARNLDIAAGGFRLRDPLATDQRRFTKSFLAAGSSEGRRSASRLTKGERGLWQRRYFEHTCRDETDLKRCADYLHANPLKHGLVDRVIDWPWSSFHRYVRLGEYAPRLGQLHHLARRRVAALRVAVGWVGRPRQPINFASGPNSMGSYYYYEFEHLCRSGRLPPPSHSPAA